MMSDLTSQAPRLLDDDEVLKFVTHGYHLVKPDLPAGFHADVCKQLESVGNRQGNRILDAVPVLRDVYDHPAVRGALISLLGDGYLMNGHRHLHINLPGSRSQSWHQDGTNVRHHQTWCVLGMYYPHDVTLEQGPTMILPSTHFRNAPTERLQTYANIRGQMPLAVDAGTVAITHYDLWHAASLNGTDRPRYMLKFLFDRTAAPTEPSWNHDPATADEAAYRRIREHVCPDYYSSDHYKEWELRTEMWLWMLGRPEPVPPGAFKDMLSHEPRQSTGTPA
jgi:hypothetical protein